VVGAGDIIYATLLIGCAWQLLRKGNRYTKPIISSVICEEEIEY
jgi:hypothetical protein